MIKGKLLKVLTKSGVYRVPSNCIVPVINCVPKSGGYGGGGEFGGGGGDGLGGGLFGGLGGGLIGGLGGCGGGGGKGGGLKTPGGLGIVKQLNCKLTF